MKTKLHLTVAVAVLATAQVCTVPAATLYVALNTPNPTAPYATWATAAATIQAAVDAAAAGDEIVVTNGTYATGGRTVDGTMTNRMAVDKPIALRSVNGPQFTIIQGAKAPGGGNGDGAIRCAYLADGASLSGFTLTNGATRTDGEWPYPAAAIQTGGGVWCASTNAVLTNCVMAGNSAHYSGGGASSGTLYQCVLMGNAALYGGGASSSTLYNCTLTSNSAEIGGGVSGSTLYNCLLTSNSAKWGGGANGSTLYNCVLTGNSAEMGGGAVGGTLHNCTLTGNSSYKGGGAYGSQSEPCTLYNCIVYFNRAHNGANHWGEDSPFGTSIPIRFEYSCTSPLPPGVGNIAADPQLATTTHLSPASPCVGAGSPTHASGVDIDGEPWANLPAMGADQPGPAVGPLRLWIDTGYANVAIRHAVSFTARNTGPILNGVWDFGDGTRLTNQPHASHTWSAPGVYEVRLTGYSDSNPGSVTATVKVTVTDAVHYVNQANLNPSFPYANWETAATNIQEAIGAGTVAGRLVLVTNGVYRVGMVVIDGTNRVALTNLVVVRSVNGPEVTVIEGATNGVRCAHVGNESVLSGFTLTKGAVAGNWPSGDGGGVRCETFGVVTNCTIAGNSAGWGGGAASGTLYNCTLTGNSADQGGGAGGSTLYNCVLAANSARWSGGGVSWSTLYNCILTGNWAENRGGGAAYIDIFGHLESRLYNCIAFFNRAPEGANFTEGTTFDHSCTAPLPTNGVGNIDADPQFVNAATRDFRLRPNSPCIDAGTNLTALISTDLLGLPRALDGNGDGIARVDMGAYEFNPYRFEPALELTANGLVFTIRGEPGKSVRLERSRDLVNWEPVATVPIPASGQTLIDPAATSEPFLFYRAVSAP